MFLAGQADLLISGFCGKEESQIQYKILPEASTSMFD